MDPTSPIENNSQAVPEIPNTPSTPPSDIVKRESNTLTVISVAVFVILSLGSVVFLYYQNQQLKNIVLDYQNKSMATPIASPSISPTVNPEATSSASPTVKPKTATQSGTPKTSVVPTPIY